MPGPGARRRRALSVLLCCHAAAGFLGTRPAAPPRARRTSEVRKRRCQQRVALRAEANDDGEALLFTSGPTFARADGHGELGMRLHGDLLMANGLWTADNRAAAASRAWLGITNTGVLEFGYGALTPDLQDRLRVFIGGLHAFSNTLSDHRHYLDFCAFRTFDPNLCAVSQPEIICIPSVDFNEHILLQFSQPRV